MGGTLASGDGAVMAETALLIGFAMVKRRDQWPPGVGGMTSIAQIAGQWMITRFKRARTDAVVTTGAGAGLSGHRGVIKSHAQPGIGVMASIALCSGGDVIKTFTSGHRTVMAGIARCRGLGVINGYGKGSPAGTGGMTSIAIIRGQRMGSALADCDGAVVAEGALLISFDVIKRRD